MPAFREDLEDDQLTPEELVDESLTESDGDEKEGGEETPAQWTDAPPAASEPSLDAPPSQVVASTAAPASSASLGDKPTLPDPNVMAAIRSRRDQDVSLANIGQGLTQIGAGFAGQKIDPTVFNSAKQVAQQHAGEALADEKNSRMAVSDFLKRKLQQANIDKTDKHFAQMHDDAKERNRISEETKLASNDTRNSQIEMQAADRKAKQEAHDAAAKDKQDVVSQKARTDLFDKTEQMKSRGVVKNALEADRLVQNAKELIAMYPDPNKMPQAQVALLAHEMSKIASGGVGTEGGVHQLMPSTGVGTFQKALSYVLNEPTPANFGKFIKENSGYLEGLQKNARNVFGSAVQAKMQAYKNRVSPEDLADYREQYKEYLPSDKSLAENSAGHASDAGAQAKQPASAKGMHPPGSVVSVPDPKNPGQKIKMSVSANGDDLEPIQ